MRVLVCGDRNWVDKEAIRRELSTITNLEVVIEGEASGADSLAREVAEEMGVPVEKYPAEWGKYGKAAGPIRNTQMLDEGNPDLVLAFHNNIAESKGTKNMVKQSTSRGIKTKVVNRQ